MDTIRGRRESIGERAFPGASFLTARLSLGACLGFAFLAVLIVLVVGTQLVERSTSETARLAGNVESRYEPALRVSRDLEEAVTTFQRRVVGRTRAPSPGDLGDINDSGARILLACDEYTRLAHAGPGVARPDLRARLQNFIDQGLAIGELYRRRGDDIQQSTEALNTLAMRTSRAAAGVESDNLVFAPKSLAELARSAAALRASATELFAAPSSALAAAGEHDRAAFAALLHAHSEELVRSPGRAWLDLEREDLSVASRAQTHFVSNEQQIEVARAQFDASGQELAAWIGVALQQPAWRALRFEAGRARATAEATEDRLARVAVSVLGVVLLVAGAIAYGIIAPARRLLRGTRQVTQGAFDARVTRGGVRELDQLAAAFNEMAVALHASREALREQQAVLEDRVTERTAQLRHLAHHDPLTGLPNRRELETHLAAAIDRAAVAATSCAVFYMDIDNFKTINDSLGHHFGDRVLREIGSRLLGVAGASGFLARLGGDEFTLVIEQLGSGADAEDCADRILREFLSPVRVDDRDVLVSLSIGIAMSPLDGQTTEALLRAADSALFNAKDHGRNGFSLYRPALLAAASHRFHTEQGLRRALEAGDLLLHFQPEVSLSDMTTTTIEGLLRWRQPDGRIATAGEFIAIAEQSGLIVDFTHWVLRCAIDAARQLRAGSWPQAVVAVNVSPQQFIAGRFVEAVERALLEARMPAACLEIELTETALQTNKVAVAALRELRQLGVAVALDDFGAGFSSLKSIDELPLTRVKLDASLMKDVETNASAAAIAHSVIRLCRSLGLTVTAEGIERQEQLSFLADCGDINVQGFLIAKPAPLEDIERFLVDPPPHVAAMWPKAAAWREDLLPARSGSLVSFRRPRLR
jgi:diguanylate cyclase (GGDEF)-like protein